MQDRFQRFTGLAVRERKKKRGHCFILYKYNILIYTLYTRMALNHIHKSGKHVNKKAADNFKNIKPEVEKLKSFSCTAEKQTKWRGFPRRKLHLLIKRYETHATNSQISEGIESCFTIFEEQVTECGLLGPSVCKHSTDDVRSQPWIHYRFCLFLQHRCWNFNIYVSVLNERTAWPRTINVGEAR